MEKKSDLVIVSLKDFPQHVVGTKTEHDLYADHYPSDEELENERLKFKTPWQEARNKFVSLRQSATMEPKDLFDYLAAYAVYSFDAAYFRYFSSADFVNGVSLDREYYVECVRAYKDCCEMRMTPRVRKMYNELRQTVNLRYQLASSTLEKAGLFNANEIRIPWSTEEDAQAQNDTLLEFVVEVGEKKMLDEYANYVDSVTLPEVPRPDGKSSSRLYRLLHLLPKHR